MKLHSALECLVAETCYFKRSILIKRKKQPIKISFARSSAARGEQGGGEDLVVIIWNFDFLYWRSNRNERRRQPSLSDLSAAAERYELSDSTGPRVADNFSNEGFCLTQITGYENPHLTPSSTVCLCVCPSLMTDLLLPMFVSTMAETWKPLLVYSVGAHSISNDSFDHT